MGSDESKTTKRKIKGARTEGVKNNTKDKSKGRAQHPHPHAHTREHAENNNNNKKHKGGKNATRPGIRNTTIINAHRQPQPGMEKSTDRDDPTNGLPPHHHHHHYHAQLCKGNRGVGQAEEREISGRKEEGADKSSNNRKQ